MWFALWLRHAAHQQNIVTVMSTGVDMRHGGKYAAAMWLQDWTIYLTSSGGCQGGYACKGQTYTDCHLART